MCVCVRVHQAKVKESKRWEGGGGIKMKFSAFKGGRTPEVKTPPLTPTHN